MNDLRKSVERHLRNGSDTTVAELAEQAGLPAGGFFGELGNLGLGGNVRRPTLADLKTKEAAYLAHRSAAPADMASIPPHDRDGGGDFDKHVKDALRLLNAPVPQQPSTVPSEATAPLTNTVMPSNTDFWSTLEAQGIDTQRPPVSPFTFRER